MPNVEKNEIFKAKCAGYTSEGLGIARIDGRAVFVKGLLFGERALIKIIRAGKNAVYGKIEEIETVSPHRVHPDCAAFGRCGGCALRHMDYEEELRLKRQRVDDAFQRIGGLSLKTEEIVGAEDICGYRNKTIYTVGKENGKTVTGFYKARTHELISAPNCEIESDYSRRAAAALRDFMDRYGVDVYDEKTGKGIRRLMCRFGFSSGEGQAVIVTGKGNIPHTEELVRTILNICPETVSIMRNINAAPGDTVLSQNYSVIWGKDHIEDQLLGLTFRLAPGAFYQVNHDQAERLYTKALEFAGLNGGETALDLYCGAGTITLCLARKAEQVIGAEIVESAVKNARENAKRNGIENSRFICADASETAEKLKNEGFRPDVVIVDPPRKGLSPEIPGIIASMEPERVVYVSCDPATLARDLKIFDTLGYKAKKAAAVDMFPRTHHVETVVLMSRVDR